MGCGSAYRAEAGGRTGPAPSDLATRIAALAEMDLKRLRAEWRRLYRSLPPARLSRDLLIRGLAYKMQERVHGGLSQATRRKLRTLALKLRTEGGGLFDPGISLKPSARLVREWHGKTHTVIVREDGFEFDGKCHRSLSGIARAITGARWSGPRFFGLRKATAPFSAIMDHDHG